MFFKKFHFFFLALFIGAGCLFALSPAYCADDFSLYMKAGTLEEAGDFKGAANIIRSLISKDKSSYLYRRLAELTLASNDAAEAEKVLTEAEKLFPEEPYFKFTLGQVYEFTKNDKAAAYNYYKKAADISGDPKHLLSCARVLESLERYGEAIEIYDKLIAKKPLTAYYGERGRVYQKAGNLKKAEEDLKKASEIGGDAEAMLRLADMYLSSGDKQKAKEILLKVRESGADINMTVPELTLAEIYREDKDYKKAEELFSSLADKLTGRERAEVLGYLARTQFEALDFEKAALSFEWMYELLPENTKSGYNAGFMYEISGKTEKAKEIYLKILKTSPAYGDVLKRMAMISITEKKADDAKKYLDSLDPIERDVDYYVFYAEMWKLKKEHGKARDILIEAIKDNPTSPAVIYNLAIEYAETGETEKAFETAEKLLSEEPDSPVYLNLLGYLYADSNKNLDKAEKLILKALEKDPENPSYVDSMGWLFFRKGKYKEAYEYIKKANNLLPDNEEISDHLKKVQEIFNKSKKGR